MATGDMKARLLLDSKDFEKSIKKSKKDVDGFSKAGMAMGKEIASQFKKLTAAALALNGATDVFKAFVDSSQSIGDKFRTNVEGMKTVVDNFIYSIANADFSAFADGLAAMFDKAKKAAEAGDQFGNTQMATSYVMATQGSAYREAMAKARNKSLTNEERQAWIEVAKKEAEAIAEAQKTLERDALDALKQSLSAKSGLVGGVITEKAIVEALTLDAKYNNKQQREEIDAAYSELIKENEARIAAVEKAYTQTSTVDAGDGVMLVTSQRIAGYEEAMAAAKEANAQALRDSADLVVKYNLLFRNTDEALNAAYSTAQAAVGARNQLAEIATSTNEVGNTLSAELTKSAEAAAKLNAEMARLKTVRGLGGMAGIGYTDTSSKLPGQIGMLDENPAQTALDTMDKSLISDAEKMRKSLDDTNTVVGMLGSSFSQLGSSIGGAAGNMLTFVGSALDAAQAIIPLIAQIMAEQAAHKANATAAAQDAASKTLSAYAGIPFAGVALGVAGVAAIIGAMQNIPKFAEGGIVNRATLGVFGEAGPEAVMPLDKLEEYITPRELRVTGNIKASGKDLVVVLDNYNRVRNG